MAEKMNLDILKKEYKLVKKKYNLPEFSKLNEDFDIEKLQEKETDLLVRELRRIIVEKNVIYLRFVEMFLNPSQAPMFFLSLAKNMSSNDSKMLEELYVHLGKYEILSLELDNIYNEAKEAEFIKKFYVGWQETKTKLAELLKKLKDSWDKKSEKRDKGYLG
ncbi:MAG: hypothetical protein NT076_04350 [Candidatus Pacearchaeota archaeon]|nr:hypothetical protein [Candidatus Pacearchaeota archaeon]